MLKISILEEYLENVLQVKVDLVSKKALRLYIGKPILQEISYIQIDYRYFISDIIESVEDAIEFTENISFEQFKSDKKTVMATIRCLEVLGKASKNIPNDIKNEYKNIPLKKMTDIRDKLIHNYFGVDLEKYG